MGRWLNYDAEKPRKYLVQPNHHPHLEPREHELLGREVGGAQLVVRNQGPYQPQDQLQVAVVDVRVAWKRGRTYHSDGAFCAKIALK